MDTYGGPVSMGIIKKVLLIALFLVLVGIASAAGAVVYYYHHPSEVKPLVEDILSRAAGTPCSIESLSYSLKPLSLHVTHIRLKPEAGGSGFQVEIPSLQLSMELEGSFGRKTLLIKELHCKGFTLLFSHQAEMPAIDLDTPSSSLLSRAARWATALFLFRDIRLEAGEVTNGRVSFLSGQGTVEARNIRLTLIRSGTVEISCSAVADFPSFGARLDAPDLRMIADTNLSLSEPAVGLGILFQGARLESPQGDGEDISGELRLNVKGDPRRLSFESPGIHFKAITSKSTYLKSPRPLQVQVSAAGAADLASRTGQCSHLRLRVLDLVEMDGFGSAEFGSTTSLDFTTSKCRISAGDLSSLLSPHLLPLRSEGSSFGLSGDILLAGRIHLGRDSGSWQWDCDLTGRLKDNPCSVIIKETQIKGLISASISAEGRYPGVRLSAALSAKQCALHSRLVNMEPFGVEASVIGTYPRFTLDKVSLATPRMAFAAAGRAIQAEDVRLTVVKGLVDGDQRSILFPEIALESSLWRNLRISLAADTRGGRFGIQGRQIGLWKTLHALDLLPTRWTFAGEDTVELSGHLQQGGKWSFSAALAIRDLAFKDPEDAFLGEKVSVAGKIEGNGSLEGGPLPFTVSLMVGHGEVLLERFYFDLVKNSFSAACKGIYDHRKNTLHLSDLTCGLKNMLSLSCEADVAPLRENPSFKISLHIPETSIEPPFQALVREPYRGEIPFLQGLEVGGKISTDLVIEGRAREWLLQGAFRWHQGSVMSQGNSLSFQGIELDLPLWLREGKTPMAAKEPRKGALLVETFSMPRLPRQSLKMPLLSGQNSLLLEGPTFLKIPGGEVRLGSVFCENLMAPSPNVRTSLTVEGLDLQPLLSEVWSRPVEGTLKGHLNPISLQGERVTSQGEIKARVFGGDVTVTRLGAERIRTSAPVLSLEAYWDGLNLSEITRETAFGKIEGVMKGYVRNLEIVDAQPQRFDLLLETEEKKGVPQRISVTAVDNIAQIGGGQSPFLGVAGAFTSFFREFPYRKIGVKASLENDVFKVNGTVREDGVEYIVKRGSFSGVNVVNQNPDNRIRFKDMVKRIQRVGSTGGGPQVR